MKVKMLEHYQDSSCTLILGDTVDVGSTLGVWLVENRKAEQVVEVIEEVKEPEPIVETTYKSKRGRQ